MNARTVDVPFLADMPPLSRSRGLPTEVLEARKAWKQAIKTSRVDAAAASRAFVRIAEDLRAFDGLVGSVRLVALENALVAAAAAGEKTQVTALLRGLSRTEPTLHHGIERLLRGESESTPRVPLLRV